MLDRARTLSPQAKFRNRLLLALIRRAEDLGFQDSITTQATVADFLASKSDGTWEDFVSHARLSAFRLSLRWDETLESSLRQAAVDAGVPCRLDAPGVRELPVEPDADMVSAGVRALAELGPTENVVNKHVAAVNVWRAMAAAHGRR